MSLPSVLRNKLKDQKAASSQGTQKTKEKLHINPNNITVSEKSLPDKNAQNKPSNENKPRSQWNDFGGEDDIENKKIEILQQEMNKPRMDISTEHFLKDDCVNEARKKARLESDESNKLIKILRKPEPTPYESTLLQNNNKKGKDDMVPELEELGNSLEFSGQEKPSNDNSNRSKPREDNGQRFQQSSDQNRDGGYNKKGDYKKKPKQGQDKWHDQPRFPNNDDQNQVRNNPSYEKRIYTKEPLDGYNQERYEAMDKGKSTAKENYDVYPSRTIVNPAAPKREDSNTKQYINFERVQNFKEQESQPIKTTPEAKKVEKKDTQRNEPQSLTDIKSQTENNKLKVQDIQEPIKSEIVSKTTKGEERFESSKTPVKTPEKGRDPEDGCGKDIKCAEEDESRKEVSKKSNKQEEVVKGDAKDDAKMPKNEEKYDKYKQDYGKYKGKSDKPYDSRGKNYDYKQYGKYDSQYGDGYEDGSGFNRKKEQNSRGEKRTDNYAYNKYEAKNDQKHEKKAGSDAPDKGNYDRKEKNWEENNFEKKYPGKYQDKNGERGEANKQDSKAPYRHDKYGDGSKWKGKTENDEYYEHYNDYYDYYGKGSYNDYYDEGYEKNYNKKPYTGEGKKYTYNKQGGAGKDANYDGYYEPAKDSRDPYKKRENQYYGTDSRYEKAEGKKHSEEQGTQKYKSYEPEGDEVNKKATSGYHSKKGNPNYAGNFDEYQKEEYPRNSKEYYQNDEDDDYKSRRKKHYNNYKDASKDYPGGGANKGKQQVIYVAKKQE